MEANERLNDIKNGFSGLCPSLASSPEVWEPPLPGLRLAVLFLFPFGTVPAFSTYQNLPLEKPSFLMSPGLRLNYK